MIPNTDVFTYAESFIRLSCNYDGQFLLQCSTHETSGAQLELQESSKDECRKAPGETYPVSGGRLLGPSRGGGSGCACDGEAVAVYPAVNLRPPDSSS